MNVILLNNLNSQLDTQNVSEDPGQSKNMRCQKIEHHKISKN